jgi:hypothetical protein
VTLTRRLAAHFHAHPDEWLDGRTLAVVGGAYAWRSRVSDLRRSPYHMTIENRLRRVTACEGEAFVVSEYRFRLDSDRNPVQRGQQVPPADVGASTSGGL